MNKPKLLDVIATLNSIPVNQLTSFEPGYTLNELPSGSVGTIVEIYDRPEGERYLIEFSDSLGREYAMATLKGEEILVLHYEPESLSQVS